MKTASLSETKENLSAYVDQVQQGETVLILDRGRPVARLVAVFSSEPDATMKEERLARLEHKGIIRPAAAPPPLELLVTPPAAAVTRPTAVELLLEERRNGR